MNINQDQRRQGRNQLFISGGQFSWNLIRWCHRDYSIVVQLFHQRFLRNISENDNFSVLIKVKIVVQIFRKRHR